MANQTVTTSTDLETVIAAGLLDGERITIDAGAVLTCTETPSVLLGPVVIDDGILHIDGLNISADNLINFIGVGGLLSSANDQTITINGQGTLKITGDWFDIGTTDGTNSQVIDLSTATGVGYWKRGASDFCIDVIPMIQIETGRRIYFNNANGVTPSVGDWITKVSDRTILAKVKEVGADYFIVWMISGALIDGDAIQCRKVVDRDGPNLEVSWTGNVNSLTGDIKEAGVYMEFGNARSNGVDYIDDFGQGWGGLVFHHAFQGTDLTLASAVGGFKVPSGCNIRIPNVVVNTSSLTDDAGTGTPYASGLAFGCGTNDNPTEWYQLEYSAGGAVDLNVCNFGNAYSCDGNAIQFNTNLCGFTINVGSIRSGGKTLYEHTVVCQATELDSKPAVAYLGWVQDCVAGVDIKFCMVINPRVMRTCFGGETSISVKLYDCIYSCAGGGTASDTANVFAYSLSRIDGGAVNNCIFFGTTNVEFDRALSLSYSPNSEVNMFLASATQDYTEDPLERNFAAITSCQDCKAVGFEFIGAGTAGNNMFNITDQSGLKLRCVGMIDDKVDLGSSGEYGVYITGLCDNIDIARLWFDKTSTVVEEFIYVTTSTRNVLIQNCSGKYASEMQPSGGANTRFKGIHGGSGTPGDSTGWEDTYSASYGNSFHDGFQSDTAGTIACLMITPSLIADETTTIAGNPKFFKDGDLDIVLGDIIEFEMGYFAKGHTGFTGNYSATSGTSGWFADEWGNTTLDFQWQIDGGSWNGTWLDVRTPANWTAIPGTMVAGIKLKFRFTATGTQSDMSMLLIDTTTSLQDQLDNLYPIDQVTVTVRVKAVTIAGDPVVGARVRVVKDVGGAIVIEGTTNALGIVEDTAYVYLADELVSGYVRKGTTYPFYKQGNVAGDILDTGLLMTAVMVSDE